MRSIFQFSKYNFILLLVLAFVSIAIILSHVWSLENIPRGLYVDEASIGLNAASIASSLTDEHGKFIPIYFEAFGEFKNPIYIYATSILFMIFGVSDFVLRFTSFIFYIIFLIGFIKVVRELFPQNNIILLFSLVAAGFLPWLFTLSRISFEVISQSSILIWAIFFTIRTFSIKHYSQNINILAMITGVMIGLSIYTYSTSRLLVFTLLGSIFFAYHHKKYWVRHAWLIAGFCLSLIPYAVFSLIQSGALTHRFSAITYVFDSQLSLMDKASVFFNNYFSYFDLDFLLFNGDANLRHHTGYGGEIYISIFILFIIGIWTSYKIISDRFSDSRLYYFLLINLFSAPIAASLTESFHSLRSSQLGIYILIFSLFGFYSLLHIKRSHLRYITPITLAILLIIESVLYIHHYFTSYPSKTIQAFESYGFKENLSIANTMQPNEIIVSRYANQPYAHLEYYKYQVDLKMPAYISEPTPTSNRCIIYLSNQEVHTDVKYQQLNKPEYFSKLYCFDTE